MFKCSIGNDKFRLYAEDSVTPEFKGVGVFSNKGKSVKLNPLPAEMTESAGYSGRVLQGITSTASNFTEGGRYLETALENAEDVTQMLEDSKSVGQKVSKWAWVPETGLFYIQLGMPGTNLTDKQLQSVEERDAECRQNIVEALLMAEVFAPQATA